MVCPIDFVPRESLRSILSLFLKVKNGIKLYSCMNFYMYELNSANSFAKHTKWINVKCNYNTYLFE